MSFDPRLNPDGLRAELRFVVLSSPAAKNKANPAGKDRIGR